MNTTTKGRDLSDLAHKSGVARKASAVQIVTKTGDELLEELPIRMGCRGEEACGKSTMGIHILQHQINEAAGDDDHIRWMFEKEKPELCADLLATDDLAARRTYLRDAHKIYYIDFDKKGFQKIFPNLHKKMRPCVTYVAVSTWEEAYAAKDDGIAVMTEHAAKWGWKGCWFIIDNGKRAWQMTRDFYVRGITGMSNNDLMMEFNMKNPGKDSEAASKRAAEINDLMNYSVITPAHDDEWLYKMMDTGSNLLLLAPSMTRKFNETDENGITKEWEEVMIGGAPGNRFLMDILIRKWRSADKKTFYARIEKVRGPELSESILSAISTNIENPTFGRILNELKKLERLTIASNEEKHEKIEFYDELPDLKNLPKRDAMKERQAETSEALTKAKQALMPAEPSVVTKGDLSDLKKKAPPPPPPRKKAPPPPPRKKDIEPNLPGVPSGATAEIVDLCGEVNPTSKSTCWLEKGHETNMHEADKEGWLTTQPGPPITENPGFDDAVDDMIAANKQSDLKAMAKERGLSTQGKKRAMASRILEYDLEHADEPEEKPEEKSGIDIPENPWS